MPFSILRKMDEDLIKYNQSLYCMEELNKYHKCLEDNPKQECMDLFELWIKCNEKPFTNNTKTNTHKVNKY